ncbi:hypothetical protein BJ170DRAFT_125505 [Xylariales sp. AK1849]|nr:hypothetical protein BJ170DRAFT_125505 [Xylariales sp. AK1849]
MNRTTATRLAPLMRRQMPSAALRLQRAQVRAYADVPKPPSQHTTFYKTFGRPIFKVALMAIFTYQLAYFAWLKLETNEIREDIGATIAGLERRIEELEGARK